MFRKNRLAMIVSEFLGTTALTLIVLAITHSQLSLSFFIALAAGLLMALLSLTLGGVSGAIFNPAITIGLWTVRKLRTVQAIFYIAAQILGGYVAWILFEYLTKVTGVHNSGTYAARVLVAEVVGTFVFAFIWAAAVYQKFNPGTKAFAVGGGFTAGALVASIASAGLANPAIALGVRQWGWGTYVLGPVLGAVIGFNLYNLLFVGNEKSVEVETTTVVAVKPAATVVKTTKKAVPAKKAVARKAPAKKPAAKRPAARRNRNAA